MDNERILDLYANYEPAGEIVLPYKDPANEPVAPIARGHFRNASRLIFRSGTLWVISSVLTLGMIYGGLLSIPFAEQARISYVRHMESTSTSRPVVLAPTDAELKKRLKDYRESKYKQPTPLEMFGIFLAAMFCACVFGGLIVAMDACIYASLMVANLRGRFGKSWKNHLAAPTNLALSKACVKLIWQGKWFSQYGAMISFQDLLSLDIALPNDEHLSPRVLMNYKFPDGERVVAFSLAAFSSAKAVKVFLNTLAKCVPAEVQSYKFKNAVASGDVLIQSAQNATVDALLSEPKPQPEEEQVVALISKLSEQTEPASEVIHLDAKEKVEEPASAQPI